MFDFGFSELVVIALIALIVLGPKRLPEAARTAGRWVGQVRRFIENVKQDLDQELKSEELAELRKLKEELSQAQQMLDAPAESLVESPEAAAEPNGPPAPTSDPAKPRRKRISRPKTATAKKHGNEIQS